MEFRIEGLDGVLKKLSDLQKRAEELDGTHEIPPAELLNPEFLSSCSRFISFDDLLEASGFKVKSMEDFKAIPYDKWDEFIRENTSYESLKEMLQSASTEWARKKFGR